MAIAQSSPTFDVPDTTHRAALPTLMTQQVNARSGTGIPTGISLNASSHNSFNQRLGLKLNDSATQIELIFGNVRNDSGGGVIDGQYPIDLNCAIERGSSITPVFWPSGSRTVRIEPGAFVRSLPVPITGLAGLGAVVLRTHGLWTSAPDEFPICAGAMSATADYDSNSRGINAADLTLGVMPTSINTFGVIFPPWAILGYSSPAPAVILLGDSNRSWSTSGLNSASIRAINAGADGYTLNAFTTDHYPRLTAMREAGMTHAFVTIAGGDVTGGASSATLIARANAAAAVLARFGLKAVMATTPPKTNADNTAVNSSSIWAAIRDYNTYIRSNNGVGFGYFDLFDQWGDRATGLWRTDLGTPTDDGTHANSVMHSYAAGVLAIAAPTLFTV